MTGATGGVGFELIMYLCQHQIPVIGLAQHSSNPELINQLRSFGAEIILGNILEPDSYSNSLSMVKVIVHTAAIIQTEYHEQYKLVNINGTKIIRDLAIEYQIKRFIHISSCGVYGKTENLYTLEKSPTKPLSPYTRSKLESERILLENKDELNLTIFRPPFIIGEYDRYVVPSIVRFFGRKVIPKFFKNDPLIGFVHTQDIVKILFEIGLKENSPHIIYNIQSFALRYTEVVHLVHELEHKRTYFIPLSFTILSFFTLPIDLLLKFIKKSGVSANIRRMRTNWVFSTKSLQDDFNWTPTFSSKDLELLISNYLTNRDEYI